MAKRRVEKISRIETVTARMGRGGLESTGPMEADATGKIWVRLKPTDWSATVEN